MKRILYLTLLIATLATCNPTLTHFYFIYNEEGPNKEIAQRMEALLEEEFYNVDIHLIKGEGTSANLDSLATGTVDMALVENYVAYKPGINSAFAVYSEVLHIFYRESLPAGTFQELMTSGRAYIGLEGSPTFNLMTDLLTFHGLDLTDISVTTDMPEADVVVELSNLLSRRELEAYDGFKLFSFSDQDKLDGTSLVDGIALKYPRVEPFVIPVGAYWSFTTAPVVTLSVDLVMMVRSDMLEISVNDLTKTMLHNRQIFTSIDPLLFDGLREDFDKSKLNMPLHEGARTFLDRDEPSFIERYAELGGVILSILIALTSGLVSLTKWQAQKKKDKIDEFYEDLMKIKNQIAKIRSSQQVLELIRQTQSSQNRAFEMLIAEELVANDSFRIYMELSKETIQDLRNKLRVLKRKLR